jgi:hypothetical protein
MSENLMHLMPSDLLRMLEAETPDPMLCQILKLLCEQFNPEISSSWILENIADIQKIFQRLPISATLIVKDSFFAFVSGSMMRLYENGISERNIDILSGYVWQKIKKDYYSGQ